MNSPKKLEVRNLDQLSVFLEQAGQYRRVAIQGLDLRPFEAAFAAVNLRPVWFLGCELSPGLARQAVEQRAVVLPELLGFSFKPFRNNLYGVDELFDRIDLTREESRHECLDTRIFRSVFKLGNPPVRREVALDTTLARRIHDSSISEALRYFLQAHSGRDAVAIMGSHAVPRSSPSYTQVARLGYGLCRRGFLVVSGGGPGLMEAANLGAFLSALDPTDFEAEITHFQGIADGQTFLDDGWLKSAWELRMRHLSRAGTSLGVPTWFYGHEPPNVFATAHAKYFENSQREEGLLALARGGVIFAEGNAGTVQEIFQDACQNYYRTYDDRANPMILFGMNYWMDHDEHNNSQGLPVYELLSKLSIKAPCRFLDRLLLTDVVEHTVSFIESWSDARADSSRPMQ